MKDREIVPHSKKFAHNDVVYFLEGADLLGTGKYQLTVKKGTIFELTEQSQERDSVCVWKWSDVYKKPTSFIGGGRKKRELFTKDEVKDILSRSELMHDTRKVDELIANPETNRELTVILGVELFKPKEDDFDQFLQNPDKFK